MAVYLILEPEIINNINPKTAIHNPIKKYKKFGGVSKPKVIKYIPKPIKNIPNSAMIKFNILKLQFCYIFNIFDKILGISAPNYCTVYNS
ncbi:MAG: hypothetical protein Kow0019_18050 [Methanobacteriaceae archaeon]